MGLFLRSIVITVALGSPAVGLSSEVSTQAVWFRVVNPLSPLFAKTVRGTMYTPASAPACNQSVTLLLHGLSYGAYAWDFPLERSTYSMARALASRGFPAVVVDELGYGASDHPNGWELTVESYGDITGQLVRKLRSGKYGAASPRAFQKVVLFGHSAGTEMSELAAGLHARVDALIASAYTHFPSAGIVLDVIASDTPRALLSDYIYFGETPEKRTAYMYAAEAADPEIVAEDTRLANLTPSGEILTISEQPSRVAVPLITAPVLLLLAEEDLLFPPEVAGIDYAALELALFTGSLDKTSYVVPEAGHTFMLHRNAPQTQQVVGDWVARRIPACQ